MQKPYRDIAVLFFVNFHVCFYACTYFLIALQYLYAVGHAYLSFHKERLKIKLMSGDSQLI